jgi:hypothetical protein
MRRIGIDDVPTFSEEPTSCETETATIFLTTTSYGVSATDTTATQVLSMSDIVIGCDVQDQTSTTTTTSTTGIIVVSLSVDVDDPLPTAALDTTGALATSVYGFVNSFWSGSSVSITPFTLMAQFRCYEGYHCLNKECRSISDSWFKERKNTGV